MSTTQRSRSRRRGAAPALLLAGLVAGLAAPATPLAWGMTPRTWFVDCSAAAKGAGTVNKPLNAVPAANSLTLHPGDQLRFRRGAVCRGTVAPRGSGTATQPIVIGAYGPNTAAPPRIDGGGGPAAIELADQSYVTLDGLELTDAGNPVGPHRGVYFTSNLVPVVGIKLENLLIHDVEGTSSLHGKNGGGIVGWAVSPTGRFSDVSISNNTIHDVSRQGITVDGTTAGRRPPATRAWARASTGIVIGGNSLQRVQGDGIVVLGTVGALIYGNSVDAANLAGFNYADPRKRDCAAGIWAWNANATIIEYNEVSNMHFGPSTTPGALNGCDGQAFDVDYNQDGTVVQYNYSHDNDGGFVLLCTADGGKVQRPHRADVRYNLSVDDNTTFDLETCSNQTNPSVNTLDGVRMYNNTIVAATPRMTEELDDTAVAGMVQYFGSFLFANNLVVATGTNASNQVLPCGSPCPNNLFEGMPAPTTATNPVTADPQFVDSARRGAGLGEASAFQLQPGSPAVGGGVAIPAAVPQPVTLNFFGQTIGTPPSIGFF